MTTTLSYYDYLDSPEWTEKTKDIRLRNKGRCEICLMRYGEDVHHRTYVRLFHEDEADLLHICRQCHSYLHGFTDKVYIWPSRIAFLTELREEAKRNKG